MAKKTFVESKKVEEIFIAIAATADKRSQDYPKITYEDAGTKTAQSNLITWRKEWPGWISDTEDWKLKFKLQMDTVVRYGVTFTEEQLQNSQWKRLLRTMAYLWISNTDVSRTKVVLSAVAQQSKKEIRLNSAVDMENFVRNLESNEWNFIFGEILFDICTNKRLDRANASEITSADVLLDRMVHPFLVPFKSTSKGEKGRKNATMTVPPLLDTTYVSPHLAKYHVSLYLWLLWPQSAAFIPTTMHNLLRFYFDIHPAEVPYRQEISAHTQWEKAYNQAE